MPLLIRSSWLTQDYRWNEIAARYIGANGRFVPRSLVNAALEQTVTGSQIEMGLLSERLQSGSISLLEWRAGMAQQIKMLHVAQSALARGGWSQMTQSDWGWVGSEIKKQYQFLDRFAADIASGKQPLNGRFLQRAKLYANASRGMFEEMRRRYMRLFKGATEERRNLGVAEHCQTVDKLEGCVELAAKGWQPIGTLPRIGESPCRTNCKCYYLFRNAEGQIIGG